MRPCESADWFCALVVAVRDAADLAQPTQLKTPPAVTIIAMTETAPSEAISRQLSLDQFIVTSSVQTVSKSFAMREVVLFVTAFVQLAVRKFLPPHVLDAAIRIGSSPFQIV